MASDELRKAEWVKAAMDRYAGPLTRYAVFITGDLELARDVVQDTFVKLCGEEPARLNSRLSPWLFTVCRNRALDVIRKESRMKLLSQEEIELQASPGLSPAAQAEQRETTNEALELIARLPRNQQEVVRLKFQNGLSYQEISEATRLSVSNVGFLLHTALRTLRQQLQRETLRKNP